MKFGFSEEQQKYIDEQLIAPLKNLNAKVYIFGSRATGKQRKYSDVDVLVTPKNQNLEKCISGIKEKFENENFPFKIDIVFDEDLAESYRLSVESQKIEI